MMPPSFYNRRSMAWTDISNHETLLHVTHSSATTGGGIEAAIKLLSNADLLNSFDGPVIPVSGVAPGTAPDYVTNGYVLAIQLLGVFGAVSRIFVPAPITADTGPRFTLLLSDKQSADVGGTTGIRLATIFADELMVPLATENVLDFTDGWVSRWTLALGERLGIGTTNPAVRRIVRFVDASGQRFDTILTSRAGAPLSQNGIEQLTNAVVAEFWEGDVTVNAFPSPSAIAYESVSDLARLFFCDRYGVRTSVTVPAPTISMFKADHKTVDTNDILVANLIGACMADLIVPASALPVTSYIGGYRFHGRRTSL